MSRPAALVTGAAGGIGLGIAAALVEAGFDVALNDREDSAALQESVASLAKSGARVVLAAADISDIETHAPLLDAAERSLGPLTTLVNNAGVSVMKRGDLLEVTPASYDRCQSVNTRGTFFLTQAFARQLLARPRDPSLHHSVISVTSSNARAASPDRGEYCVSKAAGSMTAKLFAVRLGSEGIGVYEIQPGVIETAMTAPVGDRYRERIRGGLTLIPRMGQPSDIGAIARALATGALSYCTGQAIQADGGLLVPRF